MLKEWVLSLAYATQAWVLGQGYLTEAHHHNPCTLGWHYDGVDFTKNAAWHDLDVSAIVPAGTTAILMHFRCRASAIGSYILITKPGEEGYGCNSYIYSQVANNRIGKTIIVTLDEDRKFSYKISAGTWTEIKVRIMGWWW